jgi:serine-type D-Ala-D-Ala carboxypeptidase/endopeptidase (penicillin-binding protein 4)
MRHPSALTSIALTALVSLAGCSSNASNRGSPAKNDALVLRVGPAGFALSSPISRAVAVSSNGVVYLAGGLAPGDTSTSTVRLIRPTDRTVSSVGSLPQPVHDAAAALIGSKMFVFGGGTAEGTDVVQEFDSGSLQGRVAGHIPEPLSDLAAATVGDTTYLVGGWTGSTYNSTVFATKDGTHFQKAGALPEAVRYPAVTVEGGKVIIAGGQTSSSETADVISFDPSTGKAAKIATLPEPVAHAAAFTLGSTVYVAGGTNTSGQAVSTVTAIAGSSVSAEPALTHPISDAAVAADPGGGVLLVGGERSGMPATQVLWARLVRSTGHQGTATSSASRAVPSANQPQRWTHRVDSMIAGQNMAVVVGEDGTVLYDHNGSVPMAPASNMKLFTSSALLDELGPTATIATSAEATAGLTNGTLSGDLWLIGAGNPNVTTGTLTSLAKHVKDSGVKRIDGNVSGGIGYFSHDWSAPGWLPEYRRNDVAMPTALTFQGNVDANGAPLAAPELAAAQAFLAALQKVGVQVGGTAVEAQQPSGLHTVASVQSGPLTNLLHTQNIQSNNFYAETLGKLLGAKTAGPPGTIAKGAAAVRRFASSLGIKIRSYDCSGLSTKDRVTADGVMKLLFAADQSSSWGSALRGTLAQAGQGTLKGRLGGLKVEAKTGTLTAASALSGWVWLDKSSRWAEFSILFRGTDIYLAEKLEGQIVRVIANNAT